MHISSSLPASNQRGVMSVQYYKQENIYRRCNSFQKGVIHEFYLLTRNIHQQEFQTKFCLFKVLMVQSTTKLGWQQNVPQGTMYMYDTNAHITCEPSPYLVVHETAPLEGEQSGTSQTLPDRAGGRLSSPWAHECVAWVHQCCQKSPIDRCSWD